MSAVLDRTYTKNLEFLSIVINHAWAQYIRQCVEEDRIELAKVCLFGTVTGLLGKRPPERVTTLLLSQYGITETEKSRRLRAYVITKTTEREVRGFLNKVVFQRQQPLTFINKPDFSTLPVHFSFTKSNRLLAVDMGSEALINWIKQYVDDAEHLLSLARHKEVKAYAHSNLYFSIFGIPQTNQTYQPKQFDHQWLKTMRFT